MWKNYSISYIKNNRASSGSILVAVFISSLLLSFLCSLFFNFWQDDINQIILENGDWQARIVGEFKEEDMNNIRSFPNVEKVIIHEELSEHQEMIVDICFYHMRTIVEDMQNIANFLGLEKESIQYNFPLLAMYFIHIPGDEAPRLLFPLYFIIVFIACVSLILIIHNSFAVSMNERIHQFGIFSSIGAAPKQILLCLMQEAAVLSIIPMILGLFLGVFLSFGTVWAMGKLVVDLIGGRQVVFQYHILIFIVTFLVSFITVLFSAWLPARKLSKLTPLEAIRGTEEFQLKKKKNSYLLSLLFGIEGELAGNALKAQRKAFRTSTVSLTLSFLAFTLMTCTFTLSRISTDYTYFQKYQDKWDIMTLIKDTKIEDFELTEDLQKLPEAQCTIYQKAAAKTWISKEWRSEELTALGNFDKEIEKTVTLKKESWFVNVPIVVLDDRSFLEYCTQINVEPRLDGAIILNRIWDSKNSNFRNKKYIPYVKENQKTTMLYSMENNKKKAEIPITAYTQTLPILKEEYGEYDSYVFVHFLSLSIWKQLSKQIQGAEKDSYIRVLAGEEAELSQLNELENQISEIIGEKYPIESENRIQEKITNDQLIDGMMLILGAFCVLLAMIGIANVFSNTLSFLRQRKKEFARYMSIGMTIKSMKKMFCIEALIIAGRPFIITLPLTIAAVAFMITASYLDPMVFLVKAPIIPIFSFIFAIFIFVALAYYLGGRKILSYNLSEALGNDTIS